MLNNNKKNNCYFKINIKIKIKKKKNKIFNIYTPNLLFTHFF